jgi:hypothetical protein
MKFRAARAKVRGMESEFLCFHRLDVLHEVFWAKGHAPQERAFSSRAARRVTPQNPFYAKKAAIQQPF